MNNSTTDGGADNFLSFRQNELIPFINKKYPSNGVNTYYRGSLGGILGMYALVNKPEIFDSYLLADPSFWWDSSNSIPKELLYSTKE